MQRLRDLQERAQDRQAEIDALRAKRAFEESERQSREKEIRKSGSCNFSFCFCGATSFCAIHFDLIRFEMALCVKLELILFAFYLFNFLMLLCWII